MSEQVIRSAGLDGREYVPADDYDALHAEAEALRAENGRLTESLRVAHHNLSVGFDTEASLTSQLEASRGLLREAAEDIESWGAYASAYFQEKHDLAGCAMKYRIAGNGDQEDGGAEQAAIAAMPLAATPAPEVSDHIAEVSKMAEQGERQEAVCRLNTATALVQRMVECAGAQPSVATGYLRDILDVLKGGDSDQQPGPDVRGLIEATSAYLNALDSGAHDYDVKRARHNLRHELAAHRQAQRQA